MDRSLAVILASAGCLAALFSAPAAAKPAASAPAAPAPAPAAPGIPLSKPEATPAAAPADGSAATTTDPAAPATKNRPDPLVGVWIAEFPASDHAFVLLANGTFVRAEAGKPLARGTWKKDGEEYVFTSDARMVAKPEGTAATPTSGAPAAAPAAGPEVTRVKTIAIMGRNASFEVNGAMVIYTKR